jgi:hypothetical protein
MSTQDLQQLLQMFWIERRRLLVSVLLIVVSVLLVAFSVWPSWQKIQASNRQIKKIETQLNKNQKRLDLINQLSENDNQLFERVAIALPEYKQPLNYLLIMDDIAERSGVTVVEYNLNPGIVSTDSADTSTARQPASGALAFEFDVSIKGSLEQIKNAFAQIETSLPLMQITVFDLNVNSVENSDEISYSASLSLSTNYAKLEVKDVAKQTVEELDPDQQAVLDQIESYFLPGEGTKVSPQKFNNQSFFKKSEEGDVQEIQAEPALGQEDEQAEGGQADTQIEDAQNTQQTQETQETQETQVETGE